MSHDFDLTWLYPNEEHSDAVGWKRRHMTELKCGHPIVLMAHGLKGYVDRYAGGSEDTFIADDYVLGPAWLRALKGLRAMLNGETGGLDCGTIDGALVILALEHGFKEEDL
jgi:hypothetical protein